MLAFHERLTLYCGVVPVPLSASTVFELDALLVNDSDPETAPLPVGVKATLNDELCPAGMVNGKEAPFRTNCELLLASEDTVTLAPLALIVMAWVPVAPTLTLPKFNEAGAMVSCPVVVVVVPVPLTDKLRPGPFEALLVNDNDPVTAPLLVGLNAALNDELFPAAIVKGKEIPVRANCGLLLESAETVTLAPVALMVMVWVPLDPTLTFPKFSDVGAIVNCPAVLVFVPVPLIGTFTLGPETKMDPPLGPADLGAKLRFTVTL